MDLTSNSSNLEILKMAKDIVMTEYIDKRAELHNQWLVESEHLWKTQRLRVAYPTIPVPPTGAEIVEVAKMLVSFLELDLSNAISNPIPNQPTTDIPNNKEELPIILEAHDHHSTLDATDIEAKPPVVKNALVMLDSTQQTANAEPGSNKIISRVLQNIEKLKNNLK